MSMPSDLAPKTFTAGYSDGQTAERHAVQVTGSPSGLTIMPEAGASFAWAFADLRAQTSIDPHATMAVLTHATEVGATLFIQDAAALAAITHYAPHLTVRAERWRTLKPGLWVGGAALAVGLSIWLFNLSPSKGIARLMPERARTALGTVALDSMIDGRRRCDDPKGVAALRQLQQRLQPDATASQSVTVVDWSLVNAFAVPGGRVVLTRAILEKASSADEIAGVLAHEIGHGQELHPEQGLVRGLGMWAVLNIMFTGSPGTLGNIGAALAQLSYSRDAERQADARALDMLKTGGISPKPFAGFFRRIEKVEPNSLPGRIMRANEMFASHPPSAERIATIEAVAAYPARPALSDDAWKALQSICGPKSGG